MGARRRLIIAVVAIATMASAAACKRKAASTSTDEAPPDRLAPGEIVEGTEKIWGLPLPRASRVAARFTKTVDVTSTVSPEELSNFVRKRVTGGKITQGTSSTKLVNVVPRDDKNKLLTIDVRTMHTGDGVRSEMIILDATPPPLDPNLTEDERWKKAGLVPGGGVLLDPKHLE